MSLTTMLQYDDEWKSFFKQCIPAKTDFKTLSGHLAFSNEYEELAEYSLSNRYYSNVVGTAFDYIARWIIAKNVPSNNFSACEDLIAEWALETCTTAANEQNIDIEDTYKSAIGKCKKFIEGNGTKNEIIDIAILFAKLEQIFRSHTRPWDVDMDYLFCCEEEIVKDLEKLYDVFEDKFIKSNLIKENSVVIYNPTFGGASVICGGADADIFIDGTLYDFKCTRKHGYVWNEVAQILGYFLLDNIAKRNEDSENYLSEHEIKRIAFYRARYGEIEYVDVSVSDSQDLISQFEILLGKDKYKSYLERDKIREEEERKQEELRQQRIKEYQQRKIEEENRIKIEAQEMYQINLKHWAALKKLLSLSDWCEEDFRKCNTDSERQLEIRWLLRVWWESLLEFKLDGNKIKQIMTQKNITEKEISQHTKKTLSTVKKWIKEESTPRAGTFILLLEVLNCKKEDLIKKDKK